MGPEDQVPLNTIDHRQRYEQNVSALWRDAKASIIAAISAANGQLADPLRVECDETLDGGLALTRFQYPLALLDASVDVDSGMIGCLYTFASHPEDSWHELYKVWLIRASDTGLVIADERGTLLPSLEEMASQVVHLFLANL